MRSRRVSITILLAIGSCLVATVVAHAGVSHQIRLDRSIGAATLGEKRRQLDAMLGASKAATVHRQRWTAYPSAKVYVMYLSAGPAARVAAILTMSRIYRTSRGVGVGSSFATVHRSGFHCSRWSTECQHGYANEGPGTTLFMNGSGTVDAVALAYGH